MYISMPPSWPEVQKPEVSIILEVHITLPFKVSLGNVIIKTKVEINVINKKL